MAVPTIDIASVTSTDALNDATVQNVGTPSNVALAFTIPRQSRANVQSMVENSITQHGLQTAAQVAQRIADAMPSVKDGEDGHTPTTQELTALMTPLIPSPIAGANGKSAYQEWIDAGNSGNVAAFLAALKGVPGASVKGDKGDAATIAVGTVTTGAAGSQASVTNSGTSSAAVLDFTIPRGANGTNGTPASVAIGTVSTLAANAPATVQNAGTSSAAVLNFGIPQGVQGVPGTTDHSQLTNLTTGDPHTQYLNQARGDARYGQLAASNTWTADQRFTGAAGGGNNGVVGIVVLYGGKVLPVKASSKGLLGLLGSTTRILFVDDV